MISSVRYSTRLCGPRRRRVQKQSTWTCLDSAAKLDLLIRLFSDDGLRRLEQRSIEKRGLCMLVQSLSHLGAPSRAIDN